MKAVVMTGEAGQARFVTDRPEPQSRPGYVVVEVKAVALNPTDYKHIDGSNVKDGLLGCDYAGIVAQTGEGYTKDWKVGDRIFGFAHGANFAQTEDGAFAERIVVKADVQVRIPDGWSFEDAATFGVGIWTCGQGLFQKMKLPWPSPTPSPSTSSKGVVLVYGGSSATGSVAIQLVKLAGYTVITTCSPHNFEFVKSRGATVAFDHRDPNCVEKIREFIKPDVGVQYIYDTISNAQTADFCARVIRPGGHWGYVVHGTNFPRDDVTTTYSAAYLAIGEGVKRKTFEWPVDPEDFRWMTEWVTHVEKMLGNDLLKPHPAQVEHGLDKVLEGTDLMRHGKVSGKKMVYTV